jgi:hypothetical protein
MSQETRQYTLFAQKNVQPTFNITTSKEEILELDYPCWIYYVCYIEEADNNANHYLIVKEDNGSLLEVNTKNTSEPDDLAEWRGVKVIEIPVTDYSLGSGCHWAFPNIKKDSAYLINSEEELMTLISCTEGSTPMTIDFDQYSLLFAFGTTTRSLDRVTKNLQQLSINKYSFDIDVYLAWTTGPGAWIVAIITNKINEENKIKLNITIKN